MTNASPSALSPQPSSLEREAFAWMQARLVELLLRHDAPRFAATLGERAAGPLADPRVRRQRELAALWHLHAELLDGILPLIRRRLSFAAPRELRTEALPARGRVDWPRTAAEHGRERPGQHPLEVRTRRRRRHFGTPENLLVVATLLECRASAEQLLEAEQAQAGPAALRHPLREVIAACDRELAFPQLAGLVPEAAQLLAEGPDAIHDLEQEAAETLPPGRGGAYDDLLAWRQRRATLSLADQAREPAGSHALGADPASAELLYRLWLFYEIVDLLQRRGALVALQDGGAGASFVWGEGAERRRYRLVAGAEREARWSNTSPVRLDLVIEREGAAELRDGAALVWREPGFVIETAFAPEPPFEAVVARTLARLQLAGERHGALLIGLSGEASEYDVAPQPEADPGPAGIRLGVRELRPAIGGEESSQAVLAGLLAEAHASIGPPVPIACHGIFLDTLSAAERSALLGRDGTPLPTTDLLACPKPHVGPWRVDLVSRERHCCRDRRLCHIAGQVGAQPPLRPPRSVEELIDELAQVVERRPAEEVDEAAIDAIAGRVEALTRRFAELAGDFGDIVVYEGRLRDTGMEHTLHLLGLALLDVSEQIVDEWPDVPGFSGHGARSRSRHKGRIAAMR